MTDEEVLKLVLAVVLAGADTTALFIAAIFRYLLKHPKAYTKLQDEIDALADNTPFTELRKVPFLDAVVKETARLYSVIRFILERVTPPGGTTIAGEHIPGNTVVGVSPWAYHRREDVFGERADEFRPERWLDPGRNAVMSRKLLLFGHGKYQCLGMHIAYMEVYKVVPAFLKAFKVRRVLQKRLA